MIESRSGKISRRDILKLGLVGSASVLLPEVLQAPDWIPPAEFTQGNRALPIRRVETDHPYVSLTFDDGFFPEEVERFLRLADEAGLTFTLFPVGAAMTASPDLWRPVKDSGHEIGNHSHLHRDASTLSPQEIDWDFRTFEEVDYPEVFGEPFPTPGYARVPLAQGPVNFDVQEVVYDLEDLHVHWRVDSYSWRRLGSNPDFLVNNVSKAEAGDIVVLHLGQRDLDVFPRYLEALAAKGLQHVPFSTLWDTRRQSQEPAPKIARRSFLSAPIYHPKETHRHKFSAEELPNTEGVDRPDIVFGVYLPYHILPAANQMRDFEEYVLGNGVNSVVIDIKNEAGRVNIPFEHPNKPNVEPDYMDNPDNVRTFLNWATAHNIYVIGRHVVMTDTRFARANPSLALHDITGGLWNGADRLWANPYAPEVADYNAAIARAAADFGIREIMFDYVRFPSGDTNTGAIVFPGDYSPQGRVEAITNIIRAAHDRLADTNSLLSAAFFGYTAWDYQGEMGIGQSLEAVGPHLDGLSPMAYPDLYGSGINDCDNLCRPAPMYPWETLFYTVTHTRERLLAVNPQILVTPWIQAYPNITHHVPFSTADIDRQLQGAFTAHADGVLAWNPSLAYPDEIFSGYPADLYT